jgi:hypothetical protein
MLNPFSTDSLVPEWTKVGLLQKGDLVGHPFHGNQYSSEAFYGLSNHGSAKSAISASIRNIGEAQKLIIGLSDTKLNSPDNQYRKISEALDASARDLRQATYHFAPLIGETNKQNEPLHPTTRAGLAHISSRCADLANNMTDLAKKFEAVYSSYTQKTGTDAYKLADTTALVDEIGRNLKQIEHYKELTEANFKDHQKIFEHLRTDREHNPRAVPAGRGYTRSARWRQAA